MNQTCIVACWKGEKEDSEVLKCCNKYHMIIITEVSNKTPAIMIAGTSECYCPSSYLSNKPLYMFCWLTEIWTKLLWDLEIDGICLHLSGPSNNEPNIYMVAQW
jgi:hypothetical protein